MSLTVLEVKTPRQHFKIFSMYRQANASAINCTGKLCISISSCKHGSTISGKMCLICSLYMSQMSHVTALLPYDQQSFLNVRQTKPLKYLRNQYSISQMKVTSTPSF